MKNETIHTCTPSEVDPANAPYEGLVERETPRADGPRPQAPRELADAAGSQAPRELAGAFATEHYDEIFRYCARHLPTREDAQDATQEVFLRLVRSNALYERRGKPLAYLYTCARNVCAEFYRRPSMVREPAEGWEERIADPDSQHNATRLEMADALSRLSALEQEVLELRYGQGLTMNEIAAAIGRSRFAVRRIEKRALAALEAMIGDRP